MMWMTRKSVVMALSLALSTSLMTAVSDNAVFAQGVTQTSPVRLSAIESINLSGEGDAAELVIMLSAPVTYTSYKTTAPLRLVVDLSQTNPGTVSVPLVLNKGNFKTVTASRYDTDAGALTRVDIELAKDAEAVITATPGKPGELRISFPSLAATASADAAPVTPVPVSTSAAAAPPESTPSEVPVSSSTTTPISAARSLTSISVKNNAIILAITGGVAEFKSFRLNNPERFVVDLSDVKSVLADRLIPVNAVGVASARLGLYPDKLRVVFDAVNGTFPETTVSKSAEGLVLTLSSKPVDENSKMPLTAAQSEKAPVTPPKPSSQPLTPVVPASVEKPVAKAVPSKPVSRPHGIANVEMIDFQVVDGVSRVSVRVSGDVEVEPLEKTAGFVTLTIKNAILPKYLQRSLETKGFISPVLRVTPLIVKTRKGSDTKVRIAMRAAATPDFRQEADMLYVDFKNPEGMTADMMSADLQEDRGHTARSPKAHVGKEVALGSELSEPTAKPQDTGKSYKGRKVTLEFADAEVRKIFQLLSEVSSKNFVLGDDVTGTISIKLVNVPWDQALDIILDTKGLDKREDGNIIIIKGKGKFKSQAEEEQEIKKALTKAIELKTETFSINYADISGIAGQFASLKSDRGLITQDARTNKVIVKDIPQALDDMRRLLQQLDVPEKQVMIEARIVEATSTFTRNLGVNWGVHFRDGSASFLGINSLDTGFGGLVSAPPTSGTGTSAGGNMGISFGTLTSNIQLDMRLNAAASAGLIKIVSTPKVATLNNKTAKITQGQQIPYTSSTSDKVETKFIEAALSLEVTPHINANGTIGMKIDAKNDSPGSSTGGSAPPINKKQATTEMLLRDGETTVIGGIYVDSDNESDDGVPFLMDIPFLGKLFKTNNKTKSKTELLIFITPRILGAI